MPGVSVPSNRFGYNVLWPNPLVLAGVLLVCLVAYGSLAFNLNLAGDEWALVRYPTKHYEFSLAIGRWMAVVLWLIFYDNRFAPAVTLFAALSLMSVGAIISARPAGASDGSRQFVYASLLVLNPVLAESLSFESKHLALGF